jgi:hypothetical protein
MARGRFELTPSLLASALVHGAVGLAIFLFWPKTPPSPIQFGEGVPINIVSESQAPSQADEGPVVQPAATETPVPEPVPTPPSPSPAPVVAPKDFMTPSKPVPAQRPRAPGGQRPAEPSFEEQTQQALSKGGGPRSSAPQGHTQKATDTQAHVGTYDSLSAGEKVNFAGQVGTVWEKNCLVLGGAKYDVFIEVVIGPNGYFTEQPKARAGTPSDFYTQAAVTRAIAALKKIEPFQVPSRFSEFRTTFHFDPKSC